MGAHIATPYEIIDTADQRQFLLTGHLTSLRVPFAFFLVMSVMGSFRQPTDRFRIDDSSPPSASRKFEPCRR